MVCPPALRNHPQSLPGPCRRIAAKNGSLSPWPSRDAPATTSHLPARGDYALHRQPKAKDRRHPVLHFIARRIVSALDQNRRFARLAFSLITIVRGASFSAFSRAWRAPSRFSRAATSAGLSRDTVSSVPSAHPPCVDPPALRADYGSLSGNERSNAGLSAVAYSLKRPIVCCRPKRCISRN